MSTNYPLGGTLSFTAEDELDIQFEAAPITKAEALAIGMDLCEASAPEREALLAELGATMAKRSLLVLSNVAARLGDHDAAAYARDLRDSIATKGETEAAV